MNKVMKKPLLLGLMISTLGAADLELAEVTVSPPQDIQIDMETEAVPKAFLKPSPRMSAAAAALSHGDGEGERMRVTERVTIHTVSPELNRFYNKDEYVTRHIQQLIVTEATYTSRAKVFSTMSGVLMWLGGLSTTATVFVSALGAAEVMDSRAANVTTTLLGGASGLCVWAANQLKKTAGEYHKASSRIQLTLGIPREIVSPMIDIKVDLPKASTETDMRMQSPTSPHAKPTGK